ncbi:MAG TPA: hypothetical protein PKN62_01535 [bacterium]|nr:hypothetical protein [bacterium]
MDWEIDEDGFSCLRIQKINIGVVQYLNYLTKVKKKKIGEIAGEIIRNYSGSFFQNYFLKKDIEIELVVFPKKNKNSKVLTFEEIVREAKKRGYKQTFPEVALILGAELNQADIQKTGCSNLIVVHNYFRTEDGLLNLLGTNGSKVSAELADAKNENYPRKWSMTTGFVFQK